MPTRLPYGLSFIKPDAPATAYTFVAGDTTPDVPQGTVFFTAASAVTITNFDGAERGKVIFVTSMSNGAITLQNSAGGIQMRSVIGTNSAGICKITTGGNYLMRDVETVGLIYTGTTWCEIGVGVRVP